MPRKRRALERASAGMSRALTPILPLVESTFTQCVVSPQTLQRWNSRRRAARR